MIPKRSQGATQIPFGWAALDNLSHGDGMSGLGPLSSEENPPVPDPLLDLVPGYCETIGEHPIEALTRFGR